MSARGASGRILAALLALGAGAAGLVVAVELVRSVPGPVGSSALPVLAAPGGGTTTLTGGRIATPTEPGFPSPPLGAIVLAREAGSDALGLAIVLAGRRPLVRVSVVGPEGPGLSGLAVAVTFGAGAPVALAPCGVGCYQAHIAVGGAHAVTVALGRRRVSFTLPASVSPPGGAALVARATRVWRGLRSVVWHERLASSPTDVLVTRYVAVAPDSLSYTIRGLSAAVIIGGSRWDRTSPSSPWVSGAQNPPLQVPAPFWASVSDARILGSLRVDGQSAWVVSFFDQTTPAWFEAEIAKRTGRTLTLSMIAASHFMQHTYGPFDAALRLTPPTAVR